MIADSQGLKRCPGCKLSKQATTEFFNKSKYENDGLDCYCKFCRNQISIKWRRANPEVYLVKMSDRKRRRYAETGSR